jgi:hypothetical protein
MNYFIRIFPAHFGGKLYFDQCTYTVVHKHIHKHQHAGMLRDGDRAIERERKRKRTIIQLS